jgi:hypothetical protein
VVLLQNWSSGSIPERPYAPAGLHVVKNSSNVTFSTQSKRKWAVPAPVDLECKAERSWLRRKYGVLVRKVEIVVNFILEVAHLEIWRITPGSLNGWRARDQG